MIKELEMNIMNGAPVSSDTLKVSKFRFLGLDFHSLDMSNALARVKDLINLRKPSMVLTPTAELIVRASEDPSLKKVYNDCSILTVDGFVVYYFARLFGKPVAEPVSAVRLMMNFLEIAEKNRYRIYLLGATEEVVNLVAANLKNQYPDINIVGHHNGYFDFNKDYDIITSIKFSKPDLLFVAMSSPLKEHFISKNLSAMEVPVCIGVGGAFDIIAGKCRLAPAWVSRIGLEWFYRLIQEPGRMWKRYLITNTKFLLLLFRELYTEKKHV